MKNIFLLTVLLSGLCRLSAQQTPYHAVFDLTSGDTLGHQSVIRWLEGITGSYPDAKLEVVLYGQSLGLVQKDKSIFGEAIARLTKNKNLKFTACEQAMKRYRLSKSDLLPGVETGPDGIYEIIQRLSQGWGYIKAAR